MADIELIRGI